MFEGHDTTSAAVLWSLFMLGCHQDVQQRIYEEIRTICGVDGEVTMEELGKLNQLDACVKEVLRLYPSVPFITRRLASAANIGGHIIPANTQVMVNINLIHRDPQEWDEPEKFKPQRYLLFSTL